jgi:hypothetical protein
MIRDTAADIWQMPRQGHKNVAKPLKIFKTVFLIKNPMRRDRPEIKINFGAGLWRT